jgi:hypothetical protein
MYELKMGRMQGDARNAPLRGFRRVVFSIADDRVSERGKLHPDLILQPRDQSYSHERGGHKRAFDGVGKLGTRRLGVALRSQLFKHSLPPKVVNERPFFGAEVSADHREVLPDRSVGEKLSNERVPIRFGLGKEQHPGRKTIDAMYDQGALPPRFQPGGKKRQGGRSVGAFDRHGRKSRWFVEGHDGIVFVEHGKLA